MIYTVTLNPALDYVMRLPQLRQGEVNRAHSEEIQLGGKGINVSRVLSELGEASTALGFIAGFTGDALQQGLRAMGLRTDFVRLKRGATRINVKLKAQGETDINCAGLFIMISYRRCNHSRILNRHPQLFQDLIR